MNCHTLYGCRVAIRQITGSKTQTELLGRHLKFNTCINGGDANIDVSELISCINICVAIDTMLNFDDDANAENGLNVNVAIATQALTSSVSEPYSKPRKVIGK